MLRIAVLIVFVVACSKAKDQEASPPPPSPPPVADAGADVVDAGDVDDAGTADAPTDATGRGAAASDFDFDKLSHEDKVKFMKQKVVPTMKPLLTEFDPKEFKNVTCKTCHGKNPQGTKYKMPSPDLPALDFDAIKAGKEDPKMVEFMANVVKPRMAKLLNEPEASEDNPDGFGCLHCHTVKKKKKK
jgi:hypothetical protein